jgi:outer membrane protein assembly factor BamB
MRVKGSLSFIVACTLAVVGFGVGHAEAACTSAGSGGDWPVFQHDVTAGGAQPAETKIGPGNVASTEVAWVAPLEGGIQSEPVEHGGCVFIGTDSGQVTAYKAATGDLVWRRELTTATTLSVAGGRVFVLSSSVVTALDESTGAILWQRDLDPYFSIGSPLAAENFVIIGLTGCSDFGAPGCRGYYALLDQADGHTIVDGFDVSDEDRERGMQGAGFWSHPSYDPDDKYIYFGSANTRSIRPENPLGDALVKIDADPTRATFGKIVGYFRDTPLSRISTLPVADQACGGALPANAGGSCIDDDDFPTTAIIFRDSAGKKMLAATHPNVAGIAPGFLASFAVPKGNFYAIDPTTEPTQNFGGTPMRSVWSAPTTGARAAAAAYDGSKLYYSSGYDCTLMAVEKNSGDLVWQSQAPCGLNGDARTGNLFAHVTVANGVVYWPNVTPFGGFLAFSAHDGAQLVQKIFAQDVGVPALPTGSDAGGVTIARNMLFVGANARGAVPGYLIAYRLPS